MSASVTLFIVVGVGEFLWDEHPWLIGGLALTAALAVGMLARQRRSPFASPPMPVVHPGISAHSIPIAGGVGLVFVMGYVTMFWFGVPMYRPVVLGVVGAGSLLGLTLILFGEHRRVKTRDDSILHLADPGERR
jgi:hypothetical protein